MESEKPCSRKELRELDKSLSRQQKTNFKLSRSLTRVALVGALASLTVVAPLTGMVNPNLSIASPSLDFSVRESLLTAVSNAANWGGFDSDLHAVSASRSRVLEASQLTGCMKRDNAANGDTAVVPSTPDLVWPMYAGTYILTSPFGMRVHPILGTRFLHEGMDWAAPAGTPIYAAVAGEITEAGIKAMATGTITIKFKVDGEVFYARYLHEYADGIFVKEGQTVKPGDQIGEVGSTGYSTGAHLHFEIRNSKMEPLDPDAWMREHGAVFLNQGCE